MLQLNDIPVAAVLRRRPVNCPATAAYQARLDDEVDAWRATCDPGSGLAGGRGVDLPHTTRPDYWLLGKDECRAITSEQAASVYQQNAGRGGTAPICRAAWCWYAPMSRHHGDPELLEIVLAGLRHTINTIRPDGLMSAYGLNGEGWAHGWDIEGVIYAMVLCQEELPHELLELAEERFTSAAQRLRNLDQVPAIIGSYGNQRLVYALGLQLYGQVLADPDLAAFSDTIFRDALRNVLDSSGQVVEQHGPCMHYSMTAFVYGWLNLTVRGDDTERERVARCLDWFRLRYTESGYPIAGPSTRKHYETLPTAIADLLPAAEEMAHDNPVIRDWLLSLPPKFAQQQGMDSLDTASSPATGKNASRELTFSGSHGACLLMWSILMCPGDRQATDAQRAAVTAPTVRAYDGIQLLKRMPLRYVIARQRYQTHFNYRDYLPFSGIQTWAWQDEPPIIHPVLLAPSTTQAYTLDTARQGTSHNWGGYGAGAIGINGYVHQPSAENALPILVARYDWFWCVVVFTEASTLCLEFGGDHDRRRFWTLNRVQPAEPEIAAHRVTFAGRQGRLYSTVPQAPTLQTLDPGHPWSKDARQLVYDCGSAPACFALSGDDVTMDLTGLTDTWTWRFQDATGSWQIQLNPQFGEPNPGNICVDTFQMAYGSHATRLA